MAQPPKLLLNSLLKHYLISKELGADCFGRVYEAIDTKNDNQLVALKCVSQSLKKSSPKAYQLFQAERTILEKIKNENVVGFVDYFESPNVCFLCLEYCNEGDLEQYLAKKNGKRIPEHEAIKYFKQILNGFQSLHENNILHRKIKLSNILKHNGQLKIADLSFAKELRSARALTATVLGIPQTMAPEVLEEKAYGLSCDIYSIGVNFYQVIYGKYPFNGRSEYELIQNIKKQNIDFKVGGVQVSKNLIDLLRRMLQYDISQRIKMENIWQHPVFSDEVKPNANIDKVQFGVKPIQPPQFQQEINQIHQNCQLSETNELQKQEIIKLKQKLQEKDQQIQQEKQRNNNLSLQLREKDEIIAEILQHNQQINHKLKNLQNQKQDLIMTTFKNKKEEIQKIWEKNQQLYQVNYKDLSHFNDNYEKGKFIAGGGYGEVYHLNKKEEQSSEEKSLNLIQSGQKLALKELDCYNNDKEDQEKEVLSFQQINILNEDQKRYVISFLESYFDNINQKILLTMPLAKHSLKVEFNKRKAEKKYYTNKELCYQLGCSLLGLVTLDTLGIAHRDIKTDNLLVMEDNSINIADFGESKKVQYQVKEGTLVKGTPQYWSPEQFSYFLQLQQQNQDFLDNDYTKKQDIFQKDYSKSDLFSVGQCFLQGTLLINCPRAYGINNLDRNIVQKYINDRQTQHSLIFSILKGDENAQQSKQKLGLEKEVLPKYSPALVSLLEKIVKTNPQERPTLNQCLDDLIAIQEW